MRDKVAVESGVGPSAAGGGLCRRDATVRPCLAGLRDRLGVLRRARHALAVEGGAVVGACRLPWRRSDAETIQAELLPLLSAMAWLERGARRALADRRVGRRGRPLWLAGVTSVVRREPVGEVLVIGPGNYPLLLPGVQVVQAYAAGNRVSVKPAPGCGAVMQRFAEVLIRAGMAPDALRVLDEAPSAATRRIDSGAVDKVFFTGSTRVGHAVMRGLAERGVPSVMELSGCDAVCVLADADLDRVAGALRFGLRFNASQTCIAPRRVLVDRARYEALCGRVGGIVSGLAPTPLSGAVAVRVRELAEEAIAGGAAVVAGHPDAGVAMSPLVLGGVCPDSRIANADLFAPVLLLMPCDGEEGLRTAYARCAYRLGVSVFGGAGAADFAADLDAGHAVVNDLVVPTADPRLPFPARGRSGFGVTRGPEGLLEMTRCKVVIRRRGGIMPHLDEPRPDDAELARALLRFAHAPRLRDRLSALGRLASLGRPRYRLPVPRGSDPLEKLRP